VSGVLDPEEIEALMAGQQDDAGDGKSGKFDFAQHDYAVQRLIPTLSMIQSQFASSVRDQLRELVPTVDAVRTDRISVVKFDELLGTLEAPCSISVVRGMPLNTGLIVAFESDLVFQLVDMYFGGSGSSTQEGREQLSSAESNVMEALHLSLLPDIATAWKDVMKEKPELALLCSDPRLLDGFNEADSFVATRFVVSIGELNGGLWSIVPWSAIDAVRDSLDSTGQLRGAGQNEDWQAMMQLGLEEAPVDLVAALAEIKLPLKDVAKWKQGDIIPIPVADEVFMQIDGKKYYHAHIGTIDGNLAVRIDAAIVRPPK
jgi:flagellar motor switch protein FliM